MKFEGLMGIILLAVTMLLALLCSYTKNAFLQVKYGLWFTSVARLFLNTPLFYNNWSARLQQFGKEDESVGQGGTGTNRAIENFTARTIEAHDSTVQTLCTVQTTKKDFGRPRFLFVFQTRQPATSSK